MIMNKNNKMNISALTINDNYTILFENPKS